MKKSLLSFLVLFWFALPALALDSLFFTPYDDPYPALIHLVEGSKESILVGAYGLNNVDFVDALVGASLRGVKVSLVVDSTQSSLKNQKDALKRLAEAGAYVHISRSIKKKIMHAKFIVVDSSVEADGSFNFTSQSHLQNNTVTISHEESRVKAYVDYWHKIDKDMYESK